MKSKSLANFLHSEWWATLDKSRPFQKLCFMFRYVKGLVPDYIYQFLPPLVGEVSDYNLRNASFYPIFVLELKYFVSLVCLLPSHYGMN